MRDTPNDLRLSVVRMMLKESNAIEDIYSLLALRESQFAWNYIKMRANLTRIDLEALHYMVTARVNPECHPGVMRDMTRERIWVGNRKCPDPAMVGTLLDAWLTDVLPNAIPLTAHIEFERIHPFSDGNGRVGRMILYWQLWWAGIMRPENIIYAKDREAYYQWFGE
jgi:hypothetical protein